MQNVCIAKRTKVMRGFSCDREDNSSSRGHCCICDVIEELRPRGITRPGGRRAGQSKVRCIIVLDFSSRYIALHLLLQCYRQKPVFLLARQQYIGHSLVTARRLLSASTHSTRRPTACIAPCPPPLFLRVDMQQICKPCKSLLKIQRGIT